MRLSILRSSTRYRSRLRTRPADGSVSGCCIGLHSGQSSRPDSENHVSDRRENHSGGRPGQFVGRIPGQTSEDPKWICLCHPRRTRRRHDRYRCADFPERTEGRWQRKHCRCRKARWARARLRASPRLFRPRRRKSTLVSANFSAATTCDFRTEEAVTLSRWRPGHGETSKPSLRKANVARSALSAASRLKVAPP